MNDIVLIDGSTVTVIPANVRAMTVHPASECAGRECVIHNPTDHSMRHMPLQWRADRGIFERRCEHGIGHPDPDQRAYWREQAERREVMDEVPDDEFGVVEHWLTPEEHVGAQMTHGCDGCCADRPLSADLQIIRSGRCRCTEDEACDEHHALEQQQESEAACGDVS